MAYKNTLTSYGSITKFFHWTIAFAIIGMLIFGFYLDSIPKEYQGTAYATHKWIGFTIFVLGVLYVLWALINPKPQLPFGTQMGEKFLAYLVHYLLYTLIILMPLAGFIGSSAVGRGPKIGSFQINLPIAHNKALSDSMFELHNRIAYVLVGLITLHILAAFYHAFIKRDNVLDSMMPE